MAYPYHHGRLMLTDLWLRQLPNLINTLLFSVDDGIVVIENKEA